MYIFKRIFSKIFPYSLYFISFLAFLLCILAVWEQPLIGDDRHLIWDLEEAGSISFFFIDNYFTRAGNLLHSLIWGVFLSSEVLIYLSKILALPLFISMAISAFFLATGSMPSLERKKFGDFVTFAGIMWLGLPVVGETVVWITGSVYLWTTSLTLIFLSYLYSKKKLLLSGETFRFNLLDSLFLFLFSFLIGTSSIQISAAVSLVLLWWILEVHKEKKLNDIPIIFNISLSGFFVGLFILVFAPGNYIRLESAPDIDFISQFIQFIMYLGGSFFGGGSGNLGSALWLGIIILLLGGSSRHLSKRISKSFIWISASLATLLPIMLVTYFASSRTTFMAVVFILIAAKTIGNSISFDKERNAIGELIPIVISVLILVDGFVGWTSNKSLSNEIDKRMLIISTSIKEGKQDIRVPHLTTIPSRLTFMLNPEQDKKYLAYMAKHYDLNSITQDPKTNPRSHNSLKKLKNSQ